MSDIDTTTSTQDFKTLLQTYKVDIPSIGDLVTCKVISVDKGAVRLDVNGVAIGIVRGEELFSESKEYAHLKDGDEIAATVMELENENCEMEMSFRVAGYQRAWDNAKKWMKEGLAVKSRILSANKGGLMIQMEALNAFMPVSQLSPEHYPRVAGGDKGRILEKLRELIGKTFEVKVIDVNEKEEKLIVSEKAVWEDSQKAVLDSYKIGDQLEGEISALTSFGAFVKFGTNLEGLVHISEIAWRRIDHPRDVLKVGDQVTAQIIQLDGSKIYLSIKRLIDDPWKTVKDKFKVGDVVNGKILKVEAFGLMVALDDQIHGLAHISELANEPIGNLRDKFKIGQETDFEIVSLEPPEHRLGLRLAGVAGQKKKKIQEDKNKTDNDDDKEKSVDEVKKDVESEEEIGEEIREDKKIEEKKDVETESNEEKEEEKEKIEDVKKEEDKK